MIVSARGGPWPSLPLALCCVLPRRSPPRIRMFWPSSTPGPPSSASLADLGSLPLDLGRDREGDEAEQQPADGEDQDPAQPRPLPANQAREPPPPAALCGRGADARQARLPDPVPQAGPRAIDAVGRLLAPVGRLPALRGRALVRGSAG